MKVLGQVEHLVKELSPEFDFLEQGRPFMEKIQKEKAHPRRVLREWLGFQGEAVAALRTLPLEFRRAAAQLRSGKTRVNFHLEGGLRGHAVLFTLGEPEGVRLYCLP